MKSRRRKRDRRNWKTLCLPFRLLSEWLKGERAWAELIIILKELNIFLLGLGKRKERKSFSIFSLDCVYLKKVLERMVRMVGRNLLPLFLLTPYPRLSTQSLSLNVLSLLLFPFPFPLHDRLWMSSRIILEVLLLLLGREGRGRNRVKDVHRSNLSFVSASASASPQRALMSPCFNVQSWEFACS